MTGLTIVGCIFNRVVRMRSQIFVILGGKKILVSRDLQARHVKCSPQDYINDNTSVFGQIEYLWMVQLFFWRHLNQIQENRAGRNFMTSSCEFTVHYVCRNAEVKLKSTTTKGFNLGIINSNAILVQWKLGLWKLHIPKTDVTKKGPIIGHRIDQNMVGVFRGQQYICRHLEQSHNCLICLWICVQSREMAQLLWNIVLFVFYLLKEIVMEWWWW